MKSYCHRLRKTVPVKIVRDSIQTPIPLRLRHTVNIPSMCIGKIVCLMYWVNCHRDIGHWLKIMNKEQFWKALGEPAIKGEWNCKTNDEGKCPVESKSGKFYRKGKCDCSTAKKWTHDLNLDHAYRYWEWNGE